jgi:hypothetical protein
MSVTPKNTPLPGVAPRHDALPPKADVIQATPEKGKG